jgi:phage-related holin
MISGDEPVQTSSRLTMLRISPVYAADENLGIDENVQLLGLPIPLVFASIEILSAQRVARDRSGTLRNKVGDRFTVTGEIVR